jgi:hypothetical protein
LVSAAAGTTEQLLAACLGTRAFSLRAFATWMVVVTPLFALTADRDAMQQLTLAENFSGNPVGYALAWLIGAALTFVYLSLWRFALRAAAASATSKSAWRLFAVAFALFYVTTGVARWATGRTLVVIDWPLWAFVTGAASVTPGELVLETFPIALFAVVLVATAIGAWTRARRA